MEVMPPHMTYMAYHIDFSLNCNTIGGITNNLNLGLSIKT